MAERFVTRLLRALVSILLTAAILGGGYVGMEALSRLKREAPRDQSALPEIIVEVQRLHRQDYVEWLLAYGVSRAKRESSVAAEVAGKIERVAVELDPGSYVQAGQEVVWIDDTDLRQQERATLARLEQARARYERLKSTLRGVEKNLALARLELETAQRQLDRLQEAVRRGAASPSDVDAQLLAVRARERAVLDLENQREAIERDLEGARAEVDATEATLAQVRENLARTVVRAPYGGYVVERFAQPGQYVAPGTVMFRLVDRSIVEVSVALPAGRYGQVKPGNSIELRIREDGPVLWSGQISRVAPTVDPSSRMFHVYADVTAPDGREAPIPPGAFVVANVQARTFQGVFAIPRTAFLENRVYVVKSTAGDGELGVIEERIPKVVEFLPDVVLVREGFADGEEVVVTNVDLVADGVTVRVYRPEPHGAQAEAWRPLIGRLVRHRPIPTVSGGSG